IASLEEIQGRVMRCFEAGALATGARLDVRPAGAPYAEITHDTEIASVYRRNAEQLGRFFPPLGSRALAGSTDMGNISQAMPSIHPTIGLGCFPTVNHQPEFAAYCATPVADQALIDGAVAMAWTAIELAGDAAFRARLMRP